MRASCALRSSAQQSEEELSSLINELLSIKLILVNFQQKVNNKKSESSELSELN
ncbi:hypothetical protein HQ571_03955 [Candidatus Kuenenbacteria bacterium]|nr:hypothetical protein [Candidatus Kuenenbacteria bacterium]